MLLFVLNSLTLYINSYYVITLGNNIVMHDDLTLHLVVSSLCIIINYNSDTLNFLFHTLVDYLSFFNICSPNMYNDIDLSTNFDIESVFFLVTDFLEYTLQDYSIVFDWLGIAIYQYFTPKD